MAIDELVESALFAAADRHDFILSASLAGSFAAGGALDSISDIDFIVVVDRLNAARYQRLLSDFDAELRGPLQSAGYDLRINPTLGPLKFYAPKLAVLHLMIYSEQAHVEHAIQSPFTCLDWQRSDRFRKASLTEIYPVFGLQPRHFVSARRSPRDYLRDLEEGVVSFRELICEADGYREERRDKPMTLQDRQEFAYHVMRFVMQNSLKLIRRQNAPLDGRELTDAFFAIFPLGAERFGPFYGLLRQKKLARECADPIPALETRLRDFVTCFDEQFRRDFCTTASRHCVFRHAPTPLNGGAADERIFLGRQDIDVRPFEAGQFDDLAAAIAELRPQKAFISPRKRCLQTVDGLAALLLMPPAQTDERLAEIEYGACEGLRVADLRREHPQLIAAWQAGDDPRFPGGESTGDVLDRILAFTDEHWSADGPNTAVCTHNVVLRALIGHSLGVPRALWHRLQIPHAAPIGFIKTQRHGLFVNLGEEVERAIFAGFRKSTERNASCNS